MLGQPPLLAPVGTRQPEGQALLGQEGVPSVAGAHAPDGVVLREVADEAALLIEVGAAVEPPGEVLRVTQMLDRHSTHARHDPQVENRVNAVSDLKSYLAELG